MGPTGPLPLVAVTGGAGYVGAVLVPKLLRRGYRVRVLDLMMFGEHVLPNDDRLELIKGDIRDPSTVQRSMSGVDHVIHLAAVSNDPSFELDPQLGKSTNFDSFEPLVRTAAEEGARRFIYASTSSVYGVSESPSVTEDHPLRPLTDYSRYKAQCEPILLSHASETFEPIIIRSATVCGYSPRMRLDLSVNILTNHAVNDRKIKVFGGSQKRPNVHIEDITDLYADLLELPGSLVRSRTFNAGYRNLTIGEIALMVRDVVQREFPGIGSIPLETTPTDDLRSYQISSERIKAELGWEPKRTLEDAVVDLCRAFQNGRIPDPLKDDRYYNVRRLQAMRVR